MQNKSHLSITLVRLFHTNQGNFVNERVGYVPTSMTQNQISLPKFNQTFSSLHLFVDMDSLPIIVRLRRTDKETD